MKCRLWLLAVMTLITAPLFADESPFGYLYTTDTPTKGEWEYEQWNTVRSGKVGGSYTALDLRNEFEYGVTQSFSAAFYLNSTYLNTRGVTDPDDSTANLPDQSDFDVDGVSVELKGRVLDPEKDPFGFLLYVEPELGVRDPLTGADKVERALECKLVLEKDLLNDRLVLVSNITFEPEWERQDGMGSKELKSEYSVGAAYRVCGGWTAGLEALNRKKYDDQDLGQQSASAYFLGPSIHYADKEWWATFTFLPQLGENSLGEYEKREIRLRFGFDFS